MAQRRVGETAEDSTAEAVEEKSVAQEATALMCVQSLRPISSHSLLSLYSRCTAI